MGNTEQFAGKTAVITGAASGIGKGLAQYAAALDMRLLLADVATERLRSLAGQLRHDGVDVESVSCDVADPDAVEELAFHAWDNFGDVDMLINNAGVMVFGFSWDITAGTWDKVMSINIGGCVNGIRSFVPRMLAHGFTGEKGWIVNVCSVGGFLPSPLMSPYSATKFAMVALTESLYYELAMRGAPLQVSLVVPGHVRSQIFKAAKRDDADDEVAKFQRWLQSQADSHSLTPTEHARRVFDAIAAGSYWVVPQPEALDPMLGPRDDMILSRAHPTMPFEW